MKKCIVFKNIFNMYEALVHMEGHNQMDPEWHEEMHSIQEYFRFVN